MPYINIDIDLDLDEIYDDLSFFDKKYLVECLKEEGHIADPEVLEFPPSKTYKDDEWVETIQKLANNRHQLTLEEEEQIKEISKRFI